MLIAIAAISLAGAALTVWWLIRSRNLQYWIGSYIAWMIRRMNRPKPTRKQVYFCFVDHYEPYSGSNDKARADQRVHRWLQEYPAVAKKHTDSFGNRPKHTYFYPIEEYDPQLLDHLRKLCDDGLGDVEVHIHHDDDTSENLRRTIRDYVKLLHDRHGLLRRDSTGKVVYAFIHGNWALDNSRPDGRWCGVDNELAVLVETGCYADLTMPSAPSDTQTSKINSLYFARGCAGQRKSHNSGRDVMVGDWGSSNELLMIQGPLTLNWRDAKFRVIPKIESAELSYDAPPTPHRVNLWGRCGISVKHAEEHIFIKVHTHGATESSMNMLFDQGGFDTLWTALEVQYRDSPNCSLRYVTAWEMYRKIEELARADLRSKSSSRESADPAGEAQGSCDDAGEDANL